MYEKYKEFLKQYISLNIIEWNIFKSRLKIKEFKKGDIILHQGDVCHELYFINSGLARGFVIGEDGKDFTWNIFFNDKNSGMTNFFPTDYDSFICQKSSTIHIEALEDTQIVSLVYDDAQFLYNTLKKGERLGRLLNAEAYSYLHNLIIERQTKSAKERFEDFMQKTPFLLEKVPQYHIATFLGITPQHLSRLKKGL